MKIVVIGGSGMIGTKVVADLTQAGHEAVAASRRTGVNTISGDGLADSIRGANVVLDLSNSPSWDDEAVLDFFVTSTTNQLAAEAAAGVGHHIALSIVGADREPDSGYLRAKVAQEKVIKDSGQPYTIVRSTQFFEFVRGIVEAGADGNTIRLTNALFQPIAGDDVATFLTETTLTSPANAIIEIGGPECIALDELARQVLTHDRDHRTVIVDTDAEYFGAKVKERSLVTGPDARLGSLHFNDWLTDSVAPS